MIERIPELEPDSVTLSDPLPWTKATGRTDGVFDDVHALRAELLNGTMPMFRNRLKRLSAARTDVAASVDALDYWLAVCGLEQVVGPYTGWNGAYLDALASRWQDPSSLGARARAHVPQPLPTPASTFWIVRPNGVGERPHAKDRETVMMLSVSLSRRLAGSSWRAADRAAAGEFRSEAAVRKARDRWRDRLAVA